MWVNAGWHDMKLKKVQSQHISAESERYLVRCEMKKMTKEALKFYFRQKWENISHLNYFLYSFLLSFFKEQVM